MALLCRSCGLQRDRFATLKLATCRNALLMCMHSHYLPQLASLDKLQEGRISLMFLHVFRGDEQSCSARAKIIQQPTPRGLTIPVIQFQESASSSGLLVLSSISHI